ARAEVGRQTARRRVCRPAGVHAASGVRRHGPRLPDGQAGGRPGQGRGPVAGRRVLACGGRGMIPKRIELENFLSCASPATAIVLTDDERLWVLGGPNGVGKSAVFDAMTYALYAEHRGGAQEHACLVRHGANGFCVVFEFEFNGTDYRITRNRPLSGRPT